MIDNNLPVVTIEQFTKIVEIQYKENNMRPIFGLGKGGIGKTESIEHLAKDILGIGYIDMRLLMYSEVDLKGIPYPNNEHTKTVWLQNNILPTVEKDGPRGILVIDEITSVAKSVRTAAYQLLNERRLGEYKVPDEWIIVCLGNGEGDGGEFQGMEANFVNRCSMFNVVSSLEAWKDWGLKAGINPLVLGYVSWQPKDLHTFDPDKEEDMLFASPRSWKAVSDILNANPYNKDDIVTNLRIISNIGKKVGNRFIAFCKYKDMAVNPEDILQGRPVARINDIEVLFMTMQSVVRIMGDEFRNDARAGKNVQGTIPIKVETIQRCAHGLRWLVGLDSIEHYIMGIKDFISTDRENIIKLLLSPAFR